jgi:hypothetical protein
VRYGAVLVLLIALPCPAQTTTTGKAETKGVCSPAITGSGNTINIKTCGMNMQQIAEFRELLRGILSSQQSDTAMIVRKLDGCLQAMSDRHLTDIQRDAIMSTIRLLSGHSIIISVPEGNTEAKAYALEFVELFKAARWAGLDGSGLAQNAYDGGDPIGVRVLVNAEDAREGRVRPDAAALVKTLSELGLTDKSVFSNPQVPSQEIELRIGVKPPVSH